MHFLKLIFTAIRTLFTFYSTLKQQWWTYYAIIQLALTLNLSQLIKWSINKKEEELENISNNKVIKLDAEFQIKSLETRGRSILKHSSPTPYQHHSKIFLPEKSHSLTVESRDFRNRYCDSRHLRVPRREDNISSRETTQSFPVCFCFPLISRSSPRTIPWTVERSTRSSLRSRPLPSVVWLHKERRNKYRKIDRG